MQLVSSVSPSLKKLTANKHVPQEQVAQQKTAPNFGMAVEYHKRTHKGPRQLGFWKTLLTLGGLLYQEPMKPGVLTKRKMKKIAKLNGSENGVTSEDIARFNPGALDILNLMHNHKVGDRGTYIYGDTTKDGKDKDYGHFLMLTDETGFGDALVPGKTGYHFTAFAKHIDDVVSEKVAEIISESSTNQVDDDFTFLTMKPDEYENLPKGIRSGINSVVQYAVTEFFDGVKPHSVYGDNGLKALDLSGQNIFFTRRKKFDGKQANALFQQQKVHIAKINEIKTRLEAEAAKREAAGRTEDTDD